MPGSTVRSIGRLVAGAVLAGALAPGSPAGAVTRADATDAELLRAGQVQAGDVPAGWTSKPQPADSGPPKQATKCAAIRKASTTAKRIARRARSPEFADPASSEATTSAADTVYVFEAVKDAKRYLAPYAARTAKACIKQLTELAFATEVPTGVDVRAKVTKLDVGKVGDDGAGYRVDVTITQDAQTALFVGDLVAMRVGRTVAGFNFTNIGEELPQAPDVVSAVVARLVELERP